MTDHYAVLGNPVQHSQSPFIHAEFARATAQDLEYGRVLSPLDSFEATVRGFAGEGGRGCNITVPFKFDAFRLAPRHTARAALAQAANVLRFDAEADGGWLADNTDGIGLVRDVVLNASATSLQGAGVPVSAAVLAPGALAVDLMYGPAAAGFMTWATAHGAAARDGLGMLVEQAAEAFFFWRGLRPDTSPVLARLRERLTA